MNESGGRLISRRAFLGAMAGGAAAMAVARAAAAQTTPARGPNVIFAFTDEHRWQSMSFTETPQVITPNMAQLARQGLSFTNAISNYPVCSPYRAIVMTGRWPHQTGMIDNSLPLKTDEATLGKVFKAAGYATGYVGKWHLGGTRAEPFGFDTSLIWYNDNDHWNSGYLPADGRRVPYNGYNAVGMTDQALEFIERNKGGPFFLMLSWNPPHSNFTDAPQPDKDRYPEGSLARRANFEAAQRRGKGAGDAADAFAAGWRQYQGYHGHITAIDRELGRLMKKLDDLGLAENTILVYTADHGSMMGSHGLGGKRQPYEESIRIPFLVRWPGVVPAGRTSDALFGAIDFMPSLCALAGLEAPRTCVGTDLSPAMRGRKGPEPASQFIMHISKVHASGGENHPAPLFRGVRTARHTYAVLPDRPWLLFDNPADPYQMKNLIDAPEAAAVRADLHRTLAEWLKKAGDPFALPA
jgi:arylsulfatase A-like enzyme